MSRMASRTDVTDGVRRDRCRWRPAFGAGGTRQDRHFVAMMEPGDDAVDGNSGGRRQGETRASDRLTDGVTDALPDGARMALRIVPRRPCKDGVMVRDGSRDGEGRRVTPLGRAGCFKDGSSTLRTGE